MPVASGVVNRFESVITSLCGLPRAFLTSRKPSPPAPPDLLMTTIAVGMSLCLVTMPWITRAIWSAPPPVPAGTMNSTGRVGFHAASAGAVSAPRTAAVPIASMYRDVFMGVVLSFFTLNCERSPFGWPLVPRFRGIQHTRAYRFRLISPAPYRIYGVKCHSHAVIALQHETRARP